MFVLLLFTMLVSLLEAIGVTAGKGLEGEGVISSASAVLELKIGEVDEPVLVGVEKPVDMGGVVLFRLEEGVLLLPVEGEKEKGEEGEPPPGVCISLGGVNELEGWVKEGEVLECEGGVKELPGGVFGPPGGVLEPPGGVFLGGHPPPGVWVSAGGVDLLPSGGVKPPPGGVYLSPPGGVYLSPPGGV